MGTTTKIENRANRIVSHLTGTGAKLTIDELCSALGFEDGSTTRTAIRRAREIAELQGMFFPAACPANGFTYCVSNDPADYVDSKYHLSAQETGIRRTRRKHDEAIQSRRSTLDPTLRAEFDGLALIESKADAVNDAVADLLRTAVAQKVVDRREARAQETS